MSRRKSILTATVVLLLAIVILWKLYLKQRVENTQDASPHIPAAEQISGTIKMPSINTTATSNNEIKEAIRKETQQRENIVRKIFEAKIDFFGKVIDEHGQPVAGATTSYIISSMNWAGNPTQDGPATDADGCFSITGKQGPRLRVMVEHPGYFKTESAQQVFSYGGPVAEGSSAIPTSSKPTLFVLRKKTNEDSHIRYHDIKIKLPVDGKPISIDLLKGEAGTGENAIVFSLHSEGNRIPLNQYYPFNWDLKVDAAGGGVQECTDRFLFQAPSKGYQAEYSYSRAASLSRGEWKSTFEKEFFVLLRSGCYARIKVHIVAIKGACHIESFLNPNPNSRNLEYEPSQQAPNH